MNTERDDKIITEKTAETEAEKVLRFEIGSLPHLGEAEYEDAEYVFPINIKLPRVIFDESRETPLDVRFLSSESIGEIRIDAESGELNERTDVWQINKKIRKKKREVDEAVQMALIKAEAESFSLLPFPEHRYTPIQDLLAEVILRGQIPYNRFDEVGTGARNKYEEYVDILTEVGLLRREDDRITAADSLIEMEAQTDYPFDALNAALAHFFKQGAEHHEMITSILGPYLVIAGYYYRRSIEVDDLPRVSSREFREQIRKRYSGRDGREKSFKVSRYLLQLEEIGILESASTGGNRAWKGEGEILAKVLEQRDELSAIAEIQPVE